MRRTVRPVVVFVMFAWAGLGSACGGDGGSTRGDGSFSWNGPLGTPIAISIPDGFHVVVDSQLGNGAGPKLIVDTGSPDVVLPPDAAHGMPAGYGKAPSLRIGPLTFLNLPVTRFELPGGAGLLGCSVICRFATSINYRDRELTFGPFVLPQAVDEAGEMVPFQLEGGLPPAGARQSVPPTRIVVSARIEGADHPLLLDTGSDAIAIRSGIFRHLVADGRGLRTSVAYSVTGTASATVARLRSIQIAGAVASGLIAGTDSGLDQMLDQLSAEVGRTVDGLLGGIYLREFFLVVDYPEKRVQLHRYRTRDHIVDPATRVGFEVAALGRGATEARVDNVLSGTDAERQGVRVGDFLHAVDGAPIVSLTEAELTAKLTGPVGATHTYEFGCSNCAGFAGTRVIAIDDLLPLPN